MHIRTFKAANLQEALLQIRQQMGPDASVLHTKQTRDGLLGLLGRTQVEVTAGLGATIAKDQVIPSISGRLVQPDEDSGDFTANTRKPHGYEPFDSRSNLDDLPDAVRRLRTTLLSSGVALDQADQWINQTVSLAGSLNPHGLDETDWHGHLRQIISTSLQISGPILPCDGQKVVAVVGPTGVGKTTTIAKLAAGFHLNEKKKVGLVTIDTYRIAAIQQLSAYSEIMGLPMEVVESAGQMRDALKRLDSMDLVFIDTTGRSPRSESGISELTSLMDVAQPEETLLVLSCASSLSSSKLAMRGFAPLNPTSIVLTKLDEACRAAGVITQLVSGRHGESLPLSYLTDGQRVPEDITAASSNTVTDRLLPLVDFTRNLKLA
ncbi:flagellar biosynthesis protein FlhF [bacterium]|nr:flagellar biosynthesis protein FlhF [Rubripirellula sp.]MDB4331660.1 flagellar biosynthesis protein FlhF [bacterium]MDB4338576.1 flagellar biosynthesis protein FlhF [Rubripirellula sp.]